LFTCHLPKQKLIIINNSNRKGIPKFSKAHAISTQEARN
jgi:hypothetical protein